MLIPEQLFDNPETEEKEAKGISAVKALQIAQQQGQKIFTITQDNYNEAISQISLSSGAMSDIHNAINAGKTVTAHQSNISYHGWNGSGYIILDPTTGTGAYLIDGGANGAACFFVGMLYGSLLLFALSAFDGLDSHDFIKNGVLKSTFKKQIAILLGIVLVSIVAIYQLYKNLYGEEASGCFALGIIGALTVGGWTIKSKVSVALLTLLGIKGYIEGSDKPMECFK